MQRFEQMYRVHAILQNKKNHTIEKNPYTSFYNLSLLHTVKNNSFLNIFLNNMDSELLSKESSNILVASTILPYPKISEIKNSVNGIQPLPTKTNYSSKVNKNFNQGLKKNNTTIRNCLSCIVPSQTRISSQFGWRNDPFTGKRSFHKGIDIAAPKGSPIFPIKPGVVEKTGFSKSYGNYIRIIHDDGTVSLYAHNEKNLVREGDRVNTNLQIASVGATGRATGNHLHLEILKDGKAINPQDYSDTLQYAEKKHHIEVRG